MSVYIRSVFQAYTKIYFVFTLCITFFYEIGKLHVTMLIFCCHYTNNVHRNCCTFLKPLEPPVLTGHRAYIDSTRQGRLLIKMVETL